MTGMLENKVVIVTGGARGLGRSISELIVNEGGQVVVADILDTKMTASETCDSMVLCHCDVTRAEAVRDAVDTALTRFGRLDGLVNNAGIGLTGPFLESTEDQFDKTVAVNLKGTYLFTREVMGHFLQQGSGSIVNIGSVGSVVGTPEFSLYAMSKHGIAGLTRSLGMEFAAKGVRVNAVCPGPIWTDMIRKTAVERYGTDDPAEVARIQNVPREQLGAPEEVAESVAWLLSDRSSNCHGSLLMTDGGYTAQ